MPGECFEVEQFERFCRGILRLWNIDLVNYGQRQLHRRLRAMMERAGAADLDGFLRHLEQDRKLSDRLKNQFTINVTEFFRDQHLFASLEQMLRPGGTCHNAQKAWSAGCSYGAEAYSLAVLMAEHSRDDNWQIVATDIDREALGRAGEGVFIEREVRNVSPARRRRFFTALNGGAYAICPQLRARVRFAELDLLKPQGKAPTNCDLVLCRNVIIYFSAEVKQQVHQLLVRALRPGGVMLIGATERVQNARGLGLEPITPFFYKRTKAA